jgi:hypothetical protein
MPEALTYDSLVSDIQLYAERSDDPFLNQIPRLIMLAENRLASEIHGLGFLKIADFELVEGTSTYVKPARWRETSSLVITVDSKVVSLKQRGFQYLTTYWPNPSLKEEPVFYSDYDYEHFYVAPTPDKVYSANISYYERPQPLDSTNQTNWTTRYAPQLLLYASLLEAQVFLKMPERIPEFQELYQRAAQSLKVEEMARLADNSSVRSKG